MNIVVETNPSDCREHNYIAHEASQPNFKGVGNTPEQAVFDLLPKLDKVSVLVLPYEERHSIPFLPAK
jgi:hypothetical protein